LSQKESHLLLPVDSAWLALERPENPMTITVMLRVEGLTEARLLEFLRIYWLAWERFRYMPVRRAPGWWWEEDPVFSLHHTCRWSAASWTGRPCRTGCQPG